MRLQRCQVHSESEGVEPEVESLCSATTREPAAPTDAAVESDVKSLRLGQRPESRSFT